MTPKAFYIAGVQFRTTEERKSLAGQEVGDILELVPEPTNQYDPNAVKIMQGDLHYGYVPRKFSSEVSAALEIGLPLVCEITMINPSGKTYEMCEVEISEEVPTTGLEDEE